MKKASKQFQIKDKDEEINILLHDDFNFTATQDYLNDLIIDILNRYNLPEDIYNRMHQELLSDIPVAAKRFLENDRKNEEYKFSTYFGWYIGQRLNPEISWYKKLIRRIKNLKNTQQ